MCGQTGVLVDLHLDGPPLGRVDDRVKLGRALVREMVEEVVVLLRRLACVIRRAAVHHHTHGRLGQSVSRYFE